MDRLIYLASPYSSPDEGVCEERFIKACHAAGELMREGIFVYSPIAHTHPIAKFTEGLPTGWDFWEKYDEAMISRCAEVWVLTLPGWSESVGVRAEIEIARRLRIPVRFVESAAAAIAAEREEAEVRA